LRIILSYPMLVRASRRLIHPRSLQSKPLPKLQHLFQKQKSSISVRARRCLQTRVGGQRGCSWLIGTRDRSLSVGVHAQSLPYSNATRHQRSSPLVPQHPRNLNLALLPLTHRASTQRPRSPDLNRALRCVHRIMMHRSTQPPHPAMNHQHKSHPNFPFRLPCHRPIHLLCLPVPATA
jgi:hypothetical protein